MTTSLVGSVAGPVSTAQAGGSPTPPNTGDGAEFSIGDLSFRLAISDERPYERATAQFRKEQFDTAPVYGDQSLTGLWTRGQFSFHKGGGVRYYETLDGETVLNRFRESEGVDPFTPGEVSLRPAWAATTTDAFGQIGFGGSGSGFFAVLDESSGVLKYATSLTGATTAYTPTAGTVNLAAVGPRCAYVATTSNKIERVGIAAGAPASGAIYTHTESFAGLFYAKDRLWAVDTTGAWYQLSPNPSGALPVAIGAGDLVFTSGDTYEDSSWRLAETPGAVLAGRGTKIYAITVGDDGAVPALAGPVQVAELPAGETISAMIHHLGFLALVTKTGCRVAVVSETGQVTYGPAIIEWPSITGSEARTLATKGSSIYVLGDSPNRLFEVDLAQQVGDGLEFGWAEHDDVLASGSACGVFTWNGNTLVAYEPGVLVHETSSLTPTGTLTTGFHRFGTLEPKKFQSVRVRVGGTGGTVSVSKVLSDDSEVSLLTMDVTQTDGETVTLRTAEPIELLGLKFTLTRDDVDATKGPTLLGYQLQAMPAPTRHRMIRVPLKLYDVERSKATPAVGYDGSAWDRLEALENMERSGASYVFQDFRTGEAGECFIEQVEHRGTTATGPNNSGFGGVVWVTLRKL